MKRFQRITVYYKIWLLFFARPQLPSKLFGYILYTAVKRKKVELSKWLSNINLSLVTQIASALIGIKGQPCVVKISFVTSFSSYPILIHSHCSKGMLIKVKWNFCSKWKVSNGLLRIIRFDCYFLRDHNFRQNKTKTKNFWKWMLIKANQIFCSA